LNEFVWTPSQDVIERSNVKRFMDQHGIDSYEQLIQRSTEDIEWFWQAAERELDIQWQTSYGQVLDTSEGNAWAKWFIGGKLNLAYQCVDYQAEQHPDRKALINEHEDGSVRSLTYRELLSEVNKLCNVLTSLGVGSGDRIGIYMPMVLENVVALMAAAKVGAIFTPIFSGFAASAVASRLNDCNAKVLITADGFHRKGSVVSMKQAADGAVAQCATVEHTLVYKLTGEDIPWNSERDLWWHEQIEKVSDQFDAVPMDSEAPLMIAYTSGTTGKPKGAVHVHGGFLVKIAQEVFHQTDMHPGEDVLFWVTDMGWIMGPWEVVGGLATGGTVFLYEGAPDHPGPDRLWQMVEDHNISILGVSPTLIRALTKFGTEPLEKHDLSSIRIIGSTGEPWNPEPYRWCLEHVGGGRAPIINISGGTEIGACFLSPYPITPLKSCALVGPALGMAIDVFDADGKPVRGEVGELVCTKPWPAMTRGVWNDPQRYLDTYWSRWDNVWVHGDWASIDEDGYWFLHGRSDDTVNIAGKRVGPAEFESALLEHQAVIEAAAVGVPHELKGETVWCYAVLKPQFDPSEGLRQALFETVTDIMGKAFKPGKIQFVNTLPKTRSAKIVRRAVRAAALGEDLGDLSSLENPQALDDIRSAR
jgi:acetyl-CoA synthetase